MDDVRQSDPQAIPGTPPQKEARSDEAQQWLLENREAIEEFNAWYEQNGSPLDEYRAF